jgi:hypothetical protein
MLLSLTYFWSYGDLDEVLLPLRVGIPICILVPSLCLRTLATHAQCLRYKASHICNSTVSSQSTLMQALPAYLLVFLSSIAED